MTKNKIKIIIHKYVLLLRSRIKITIKTHSTKHFYLLNIKQKNFGVKLTSEPSKKKKFSILFLFLFVMLYSYSVLDISFLLKTENLKKSKNYKLFQTLFKICMHQGLIPDRK